MPRECPPFVSVSMKVQAVCSGLCRTPTAAGRVTVLLFLLASHRSLCAEERNGTSLRVFQFRCEFRMPIVAGRAHGLMASDDRRQRIAIYWMEPALFRESASFLRCCDLIVDREVIHYWIQGMSQSGRFDLSDGQRGPLLPEQKSAESVLRSALGIVSHVRCSRDEADTPLQVATFFERSRGRAEFKYDVSPNEADGSRSFGGADSAVRLLNALPYGREYSTETPRDT